MPGWLAKFIKIWGVVRRVTFVSVGVLTVSYLLLREWRGQPYCHRLIDGALEEAMLGKSYSNEGTNSAPRPFPNVNGVGVRSVSVLNEIMGGSTRLGEKYGYVAGLTDKDPGELVLMYFNRPTRWAWHGDRPWIFSEKAWIILPVDFTSGRVVPSGSGECSERVSTEEFQRRLRATLDYLKKNQRPYWETVVAEHTRFLESLEKAGR